MEIENIVWAVFSSYSWRYSVKWDTFQEPEIELFEPEIQPNSKKCPISALFRTRSHKIVKSRILLIHFLIPGRRIETQRFMVGDNQK